MSLTVVSQLSGPWLHTVDLDSSALTDLALRMVTDEPSCVVRHVRGTKMRAEVSLFDEYAAAFQFPYYFGENWDAFEECMCDLSWMPSTMYVTVVHRASEVLVYDPKLFDTFVEVLANVGHEWSTVRWDARPWAPQAHPFHTLFQVDASERVLFEDRLVGSGVEFGRL